MEINTCENYNLQNLNIDKPNKVDDYYISNLNFVIQTPKLSISKISKKLCLILNENMEKILTEFDNKIIELLSENSEEFFEDKISIEDAEEIYKHSFKYFKTESKIMLNLNKKLNIFNKNKEQLELQNLCEDDKVICLIKCKKIIFYKNYCEPHWEVFQIKLKQDQFKIDTYLFEEDDNDTYLDNENNDLSEIKKLKIKN